MSDLEYSVVVWDTQGNLVGWRLVGGEPQALRLADLALFRGREVRVKRREVPLHRAHRRSAEPPAAPVR
jgi:hypothetical protein